MSTTIFVIQLPKEVQEEIKTTIQSRLWYDGYRHENELKTLTDNAMSDRLCNLSEVVDIEKLKRKFNLPLDIE